MQNDTHSGKGLLAKNSILNLLGQVLPMLVGLLTIPYIVRGLGTNGYGILSISFSVLGYFSIFDLGLSRATVKFVAEHMSPEKVHEVPGLVWTSVVLLVALGCLSGLIGAAFVPAMVSHFFKMPAGFVGEAKASLYFLCFAMPVLLGNDALRGVLEATQRFDLVNLVKVPGSVLFYLCAAMGIAFGAKVPVIVLIQIAIRLSTAIAYLIMCLRVIPGLRSGPRISRKFLKPLAQFGGWVMVSNLTAPLFGNIERFIIAAVLSVSALTYYSLPFDLASKALIFPASIAPTLFPFFSYHGGQGAWEEVRGATSNSIKYLLLLMTPVTAFFIFYAKDILRLWLGPQFVAQSTVVLQIVAVFCFLNAFAYIPYASVQALGRPDLKAILDLITLPTYALATWWLTGRMGVNGAALAKLLVTIADCAALYYFVSRLKAFSLRDCLSGSVLRALFASAGLMLSVFLVTKLHIGLISSVLLFVVCCACYLLAFWFTAVNREDRGTIQALYRQAGSALARGMSQLKIRGDGAEAEG